MKQWHVVLLLAALVYAISLLVTSQGANLPMTTSAWISAVVAGLVAVVFGTLYIRL
jgi:uncharacterized membrane protein YjjB (DUF3815 family)